MMYNDFMNKLLGSKDAFKSFGSTIDMSTGLDRQMSLEDIDDETGTSIDGLIRYWNKVDDENNTPIEERKPIKIYINSYGGSLYSTLTMIDSIRMSKTPVWTINTGCAFSGGFLTFIAGHKRFSYRNASFLFHEGSTNSGRQDANGFRNYAEHYNTLIERLKKVTLESTKMTEEYYEEKKRDDLWLTADQAIELGVCDEIIDNFI